MPKAGQSEQQVTREILQLQVESLRRQKEMNRLPMSSAVDMMIHWVTERQSEDHIANPDFPKDKKANPWIEQKKCLLL
jgi:hypothetical protein